jgi:peptide/nickel transport system substrate-binding protein
MTRLRTDSASGAKGGLLKGKRIAGGVALLTAGLMALAACGSSGSSGGSTTPAGSGSAGSSVNVPGSIGAIPASAAGAQKSGNITWGMLTSAGPDFIAPNPDAGDYNVYNTFTFNYQMWPNLYWVPKGVSPVIDDSISPAYEPTWSDGFTTLTIKLKDWNWNNGQPITSTDLEFSVDLAKAAVALSAANYPGYSPGFFPDDVKSMSTPDSKTLVMHLTKAINPSFFVLYTISSLQIEPSFAWAKTSANGAIVPEAQWNAGFGKNKTTEAIWTFLNTQGKAVSTFATNPLWQTVYGPYKISQYNVTSRSYTLVPNTSYSGPHVSTMSDFSGVGYTSPAAEWNAVRSGGVDVAFVPADDNPQLPQLKSMGYDYFGEPVFGQNEILYNFADKTSDFDKVIGQLYVRQALQHLEDQNTYVSAVYHGDADPSYGPVPVYPQNPYVPSSATSNPYPYSVSSAESILKSHGWTLQNGVQTCTDAGSGANQCGAGIPSGTQLNLTLDYYNDEGGPITKQDTFLAADAKQAGINITLKPWGDFQQITADDNDAYAPSNDNKWEMVDFGGYSNSTYPTTFGILNTGGSQNSGDFSDSHLDSLINNSVYGTNPNAVSQEASYISQDLPAMYQPLEDIIWAWKTNVSATTPNAFESLTQYSAEPQFWYLTK